MTMNRRSFLKSLVASLAATQIPFDIGTSISWIDTKETYHGITIEDLNRAFREMERRAFNSPPSFAVVSHTQYRKLKALMAQP